MMVQYLIKRLMAQVKKLELMLMTGKCLFYHPIMMGNCDALIINTTVTSGIRKRELSKSLSMALFLFVSLNNISKNLPVKTNEILILNLIYFL